MVAPAPQKLTAYQCLGLPPHKGGIPTVFSTVLPEPKGAFSFPISEGAAWNACSHTKLQCTIGAHFEVAMVVSLAPSPHSESAPTLTREQTMANDIRLGMVSS